ncbi:unnamed protein product [Cylicocyclus nassatus]|uniref:Uncharacterized protein n=1 Tax=Cylicocyclus nassatus TaxID=53992 RepID=A0AA36DNH7_CYLNA|nr:unnamed protein product [Cylicocyclus nassatus]
MGKVLAGTTPEDQAPLSYRDYIQDLNNMSVVQVVILIQFICAAALTIFAVVGVSINQRVGFLLLLALLQFLIALPGFGYHFTRRQPLYVSYMVFQSITLGSEIIWFIYIVATESYTAISIIVLVILIFVQASAILAATLFKNVFINLKDVKLVRHHRERVEDKIEEGNEGSAETPKSTKKTSSLQDETLSQTSRRRRYTSRELEQGVDQSRRGVPRGKKHPKHEESLRKFKEGRRKMRELAQQLREKRDREKARKTESSTSEKHGTGAISEGARSSKESSRSAEDDKKKDEVLVSPLATAIEG